MSTLPKSRIRIAGDLFRFNRLVDQLRPSQTNQFEEEIPLVPRFHGADSLQVEVAVFNDGALLKDLTAIDQLELVIKPLRAIDAAKVDLDDPNPDQARGPASNVAPIICKRIGSEHFNSALSESQWQSNVANMAHAIIALDSEEAALSPGERWLSLIALGTDGQARTLAAGPVLILGGGPTYNALPQPVVKDLRDQAAQSAAQAGQSADNAAASAQSAHNASLAAHEQAVLAEQQVGNAAASATEANNAKDNAQQAATQSAQVRDAARQAALNAEAAAQAAEQTAEKIGDIDAALALSTESAGRAEHAASTAAASADAAAGFAHALNPLSRSAIGGLHCNGSGHAVTGLTVPLLRGETEIALLIREDATGATGAAFPVLLGSSGGSSGGWAIQRQADNDTLRIVLYQANSDSVHAVAVFPLERCTEYTHLSVTFRNVATAPQIELFVNAVSQSAQTPPTSGVYGDSGRRLSLAATNDGLGTERTAGAYANVQVFNRILTSAERAELLGAAGSVIPVAARNGLAVPFYESDFTTSLDGWTNPASMNNTYGLTQGGEDGCSAFVRAVNSGSALSSRTINPSFVLGAKYRFSAKAFIPSSNTAVNSFWLRTNQGNMLLAQWIVTSADHDKWITVTNEFTFAWPNASTTSILLIPNNGSASFNGGMGDAIYIKDIRFERIGCVLDLPCDDGAGYQLRDRSGNAGHALVSTEGCTHLIPGKRFEFVWTRVSSGFLGDSDRAVLPDNAVIDSVIWEDAKSTRTTASLGFNASNTASHVASFTPAHSRQNASLTTGSMAVADRRLYLHMGANAGAVTVRVRGFIR